MYHAPPRTHWFVIARLLLAGFSLLVLRSTAFADPPQYRWRGVPTATAPARPASDFGRVTLLTTTAAYRPATPTPLTTTAPVRRYNPMNIAVVTSTPIGTTTQAQQLHRRLHSRPRSQRTTFMSPNRDALGSAPSQFDRSQDENVPNRDAWEDDARLWDEAIDSGRLPAIWGVYYMLQAGRE